MIRISRYRQRFEELVADGTADDEVVVRMALTRGAVDDPLRAVHETEVLSQVCAEVGEAVERYKMPETASTLALEQSLAHHPRDGAIRHSIIREL